MEREGVFLLMGKSMRENTKTAKDMVKELGTFQMKQSTMETG